MKKRQVLRKLKNDAFTRLDNVITLSKYQEKKYNSNGISENLFKAIIEGEKHTKYSQEGESYAITFNKSLECLFEAAKAISNNVGCAQISIAAIEDMVKLSKKTFEQVLKNEDGKV